MGSWNSWRRVCANVGLAALLGLGACGGGGGSSPPSVVGPPATAATLAASTGEAALATQAAVESAGRAVELTASLGQSVVPIGSSGAASPMVARTPTREQAKLRQTVSCAEFIAVPGCTGSITIDTNLASDATVVGPGTYFTLIFGNLSASSGGETLTIDGTVRADFLTTFDLAATSFANQRFQLTFDALSGSENGVTFGPLSLAALVEFDAQELSTVTMDGVRLSRLENVSVTNAANFALVNVALRRAAWLSAAAYVDYGFGNWVVADGRPVVGSTATISAGAHSIAITVTGATSTTAVSSVVITIGGAASAYTVTATYPAGGGAPSYVALPSGT
jgi:hypothetical protein